MSSHANTLQFPKVKMEPSPIIALTLGQEEKKTLPRFKTINPLYQEKFFFFVTHPEDQHLHVEVSYCRLHTIKTKSTGERRRHEETTRQVSHFTEAATERAQYGDVSTDFPTGAWHTRCTNCYDDSSSSAFCLQRCAIVVTGINKCFAAVTR